MAVCQVEECANGRSYPRTCPTCGPTGACRWVSASGPAKPMDELVTRSAPRWAWDLIDETLAMDAQSKAFDAELRASISAATSAMQLACERADDQPISRADIDALEGE